MAYKIDVIWRPVSGASGYDVYRSKSASGTYEYVGRMSTYYYEDFDVTPGSTFYYKVRAVKGYMISDFSDVFRCSAETELTCGYDGVMEVIRLRVEHYDD